MPRQRKDVLPFAPPPELDAADDRRWRGMFDAIGLHAERQSPMIYNVRYDRAAHHSALPIVTLESLATVVDSDERKATILRALALNADHKLFLLSLLDRESRDQIDVIRTAAKTDLKEDGSETEYHLGPSAQTAAQWLDDSLQELAAQEAKCNVLRGLARPAYAPREPRRA